MAFPDQVTKDPMAPGAPELAEYFIHSATVLNYDAAFSNGERREDAFGSYFRVDFDPQKFFGATRLTCMR